MRRVSWTLAAALGIALGCLEAGCREHQLSGHDLQALKRQTLQEKHATLTEEEKFQIGTIQARTRSEYNRKVEQILEAQRKKREAPMNR
jgi:uncharacterized protein HemX